MSHPLPGADRPLLDESLAHRLKALACTAPLHDLDARKGRLEWPDAQWYQMSEIAFQIIDQVTIAMDFDRGAEPRDVIRRTLPFVALQVPESSREDHERAVQWVLDNLINVGTADRGFVATYGSISPTGVYERRAWPFKLLVEVYDAKGGLYLRSTNEAINVLVGALDTDVEDAQKAAERKLENLIAKGRLSDAKTIALQARLLTSQYAEQLRVKLEATRRDVRAVDWVAEVPDLINKALTHIEERARTENSILANLTRSRDETNDPVRKRQAADLVTLVADCLRRHDQLQARLLAAGKTFRFEQDRQEFSGPARRATVDLYGHLLRPTLDLPLADATGPTGVFFRDSVGLAVPRLPRLLNLVHLLLTPPVERDDLGEDVPDLDLAPTEEPAVFSEEQWAASERLLNFGDGPPRRLSGLLAEARAEDPALAHLIALRVLYLVQPEITRASKHETTTLIAVDDGTALEDPEWGGADLLVGTAAIAAPVTHEQPTGQEDVA
ncbi:hypothetical protein ACI797_04200 [Geodermatophilus sp. SYSU D00691]